MISDAFSATIIVGMLVLLHGIVGMIDASTTLSPCTPFTLEWKKVLILKPFFVNKENKHICIKHVVMNSLLLLKFSNQMNSLINLILTRTLLKKVNYAKTW